MKRGRRHHEGIEPTIGSIKKVIQSNDMMLSHMRKANLKLDSTESSEHSNLNYGNSHFNKTILKIKSAEKIHEKPRKDLKSYMSTLLVKILKRGAKHVEYETLADCMSQTSFENKNSKVDNMSDNKLPELNVELLHVASEKESFILQKNTSDEILEMLLNPKLMTLNDYIDIKKSNENEHLMVNLKIMEMISHLNHVTETTDEHHKHDLRVDERNHIKKFEKMFHTAEGTAFDEVRFQILNIIEPNDNIDIPERTKQLKSLISSSILSISDISSSMSSSFTDSTSSSEYSLSTDSDKIDNLYLLYTTEMLCSTKYGKQRRRSGDYEKIRSMVKRGLENYGCIDGLTDHIRDTSTEAKVSKIARESQFALSHMFNLKKLLAISREDRLRTSLNGPTDIDDIKDDLIVNLIAMELTKRVSVNTKEKNPL